jgi:hypothetical protein
MKRICYYFVLISCALTGIHAYLVASIIDLMILA